jgi:hypothetical protein
VVQTRSPAGRACEPCDQAWGLRSARLTSKRPTRLSDEGSDEVSDASRDPVGCLRRNVRRALIGMSDKGPSLDVRRTGVPPRRRPVLVTLPVDPAAPPTPMASSPGHRSPSAASRRGTVRIFVSARSRSSRRKNVRRVLLPARRWPQEVSRLFFHILRVPVGPPHERPESSTEATPDLHRTTVQPVEGRLRIRAARGPSRTPPRTLWRPPTVGGRHRTVRRPGPRSAGRRRSRRPAARWPDILSR